MDPTELLYVTPMCLLSESGYSKRKEHSNKKSNYITSKDPLLTNILNPLNHLHLLVKEHESNSNKFISTKLKVHLLTSIQNPQKHPQFSSKKQ